MALPAQTTRFIRPVKGSPGSVFNVGAHFNLDGLHKIAARLSSEEMAGMITEELEPVVVLAKTLVHVKTGALQRSIRIELKELSRHKIVVSVTAGDEVIFYAPYQEFGTSKHPPYPYLTPAWETLGDGIKQRIRKRIEEMIKGIGR